MRAREGDAAVALEQQDRERAVAAGSSRRRMTVLDGRGAAARDAHRAPPPAVRRLANTRIARSIAGARPESTIARAPRVLRRCGRRGRRARRRPAAAPRPAADSCTSFTASRPSSSTWSSALRVASTRQIPLPRRSRGGLENRVATVQGRRHDEVLPSHSVGRSARRLEWRGDPRQMLCWALRPMIDVRDVSRLLPPRRGPGARARAREPPHPGRALRRAHGPVGLRASRRS